MKKLLYLLMISLLIISYSCEEDDHVDPTFIVQVELDYPDDEATASDVTVTLTNKTDDTKFEAKTNENGIAEFEVIAGIYEAAVSEKRSSDYFTYLYTGLKSITVTNDWNNENTVKIELSKSKATQIIVKELFVGGTPKDDGSGYFGYDKYVVLYNNSEFQADISDVTLAMVMPFNSSGSNNYYDGSTLLYESEGWIPAAQAVWHFNTQVVVEPYEQIVVAFNNAIDNTVTHSQSINFANSEYYCTYDIEDFSHALTYVSPSSAIPTSNYLSALKYGVGTGWALSNSSPGFFIFSAQDVALESFVNDASTTYDIYGSGMLLDKKVPVEWIIDGVEIFRNGYDNQKRFTAGVDAGSVLMTNKLGYSIYRNVDKDATEAIEGNASKLVYSYSGGTEGIDGGSTDPSGIDAEASIANGAIIIYKDSNNSSDDFHQREQASLRSI